MRLTNVWAAGLLLTPSLPLGAQGTRATARVMPAPPSLNGACAALTSAPSDLVRSPEGRTLLNFKRELDGVATIFEQRGTVLDGMDARRMAEIQRGVDSLMQVFVRYRTGDGSAGSMIAMRRGDSTALLQGRVLQPGMVGESMEHAIKAIRPDIDVTLRALGSQHARWLSMRERSTAKASPSGYLGVSLSGSQIRMVTDSGSFTAHCDYPMIEAVDVGSPARVADLRAGDTVVAYNGRDVVALTVNYPQLLVPGKVIRVRVRRDGKARELPVTVAERPAELAEGSVRFYPAPGRVIATMPSRVSTGGMVVRAMPSPAFVETGMFGFTGGASMMVMQGAQLTAVDDEFAQSVGLEPGVLVMRVQPGSRAADAGLRAGDMILAVNGTPVRELLLIQRAIGAPGVREVKLTVAARETPARIVTIRW